MRPNRATMNAKSRRHAENYGMAPRVYPGWLRVSIWVGGSILAWGGVYVAYLYMIALMD